jgi:hypothetical protein
MTMENLLTAPHNRLEQRLPLNKRQGCRVAAAKMQEVEHAKDLTMPVRPIGRSLGLGKARKSVLADAA